MKTARMPEQSIMGNDCINRKNKKIYVYRGGELFGVYKSMMDAIYDCRICYKSIEKSMRRGVSVKGYRFSPTELEAA